MNKTIKNTLLAMSMAPMIFACSKSKFSATPPASIATGSTASTVVTSDGTGSSSEEQCGTYTEQLDGFQNGASGVNFIIVTDTSGSIKNNRIAAVEAILATYIRNKNGLARQIPVTFSVITGHSDVSSDSVDYQDRSNNYFYNHNGEGEVIAFHPGMSEAAYGAAHDALIRKIADMRVDNTTGVSDGGELLFHNLNAMMRPDRLSYAESIGALNKNYATGLVFLSDENDICTPTDGMPGHKEDHNLIKIGGQLLEAEEVAHSWYCSGLGDGAKFASTVRATLSSRGYKNTFATGFIYTGETAIPAGEDEAGHGYIQFIQNMNQRGGTYGMFDLGKISTHPQNWIEEQSLEIARIINLAGDLYVKTPVTHKTSPLPIYQLSSYEIYVDGRQLSSSEYQVDGNHFLLTGCKSDSSIKINYCLK